MAATTMARVLSLVPAITAGKPYPATCLWRHDLVLIFRLVGEANLFQTAFIRRRLLLVCISNYDVDRTRGLPGDGPLWVSEDKYICSCLCLVHVVLAFHPLM
jgi:hypothetical protein